MNMTADTADILRSVAYGEAVVMLLLMVSVCWIVLPRIKTLGKIISLSIVCLLISYGLSVMVNVTEMGYYWGQPPTYRLPLALSVLTFGDFALWLLVSNLFFRNQHFRLL